MIRAGHAEHIAAIGDLDAEPELDLTQMLVERSVEIGQTFGVVGL